MKNSPVRQVPPRLVVLMVFLGLVVLSGRQALDEEGLPAFSVPLESGLWVELGAGFSHPGVHQFLDGSTLSSVIELTHVSGGCLDIDKRFGEHLLVAGQRLELDCSDGKVTHLRQGWMSAWQRMSLGVPLHPDRMTREDWTALPGVGERLSERIEKNRQNNGEFGTLLSLKRVSGIGTKRVEGWRGFF